MSQASTDSYNALIAEILVSDFAWDSTADTIALKLTDDNISSDLNFDSDIALITETLFQLFSQVQRLKVHSLQPCGLYDGQLNLVCGYQPLLTLDMRGHLYSHWQWTWLCPLHHNQYHCLTFPNPDLLHAHLRVHHYDQPQRDIDAYYAIVRQFGPTNIGDIPQWFFSAICQLGETPLTAHRRLIDGWVHQTYPYTTLGDVEMAMESPWLVADAGIDICQPLMALYYGLGYQCPLAHPNNHDAIVFASADDLRRHLQRYHAMTTPTHQEVIDGYLARMTRPTGMLINNALRYGVGALAKCQGNDACAQLALLDPN